MTPIEKAEAALNRRLERLQINLRDEKAETTRRFLAQSLIVCLGLGEALTDFVKMIGRYAEGRYAELKKANATMIAEHADWLKSGNALLEELKANPHDRIIQKKIEAAQRAMENIQKTMRRGADSLQRDLAPSMGMVEKFAGGVRRFGEVEQLDELKRVSGLIVALVRELYLAQRALPAKDIVDAAAWQKSVASEIEQATDFYEAYALAGYQALRALAVMTMAVSESPPRTSEEAAQRADESVATRLKAITARFAATQ